MEGERYLRLLAERLLRGLDAAAVEPHTVWGVVRPLEQAGQALAAVDAVSPAVADEVTGDLRLAVAVRSSADPHELEPYSGGAWFWSDDVHTSGSPVVREQRVVACPATFHLPGRVVEFQFLVLGPDRAELAFSVTVEEEEQSGAGLGGSTVWATPPTRPTPRPPARRRRSPPDLSLSDLQLTDDRGTRYLLGGGGGGGDGRRFECRYELQPALTGGRWLEFAGPQEQRAVVPLEQVPSPVATSVTSHERSAGEQYLANCMARAVWMRVAFQDSTPSIGEGSSGAAVDALVAVGALAPDSASIEQVRLLGTALSTGSVPDGLDEPFASVLRERRRSEGRAGVLAVGTGAVVDGTAFTLKAVVCDREGFVLHAFASPWSFGRPGAEDRRPLLWAEDDRGGHYLGRENGFSGGPDGAAIRCHFVPALDPAATRLKLRVDGRSTVFSVELDLP